jgi:hypothetical protein
MELYRYAVALTASVLSLVIAACGGGTATVGGTLSGLPSGSSVTLQNNAANDITLSGNGSFVFPNNLASNATYAVTILTQPLGATCTVGNAAGTINAAGDDVNTVSVVCTSNASITGTISGLASGTFVTLLNNGGAALNVFANGNFAFPGLVAAGTAYNVTVSPPASGQTCTVSNGSGTLVANTPTPIVVTCI